VLISAFINAFLLVPALTALAGRAAWWPSRLVAGPDRPAAYAYDALAGWGQSEGSAA
jgi:uncharacterized membrane protein YdfJ with MMPL/SSD domain